MNINPLVFVLVVVLSLLAGGGILYILEMQDILDKLVVR